MKINREARQTAKKLFILCNGDQGMDRDRVIKVVKALAEEKPRGYQAILHRFTKLVKLEVERRTITVESAVDLPDKGASVFADAERRLGPALDKIYRVSPELVGGIRVQVGSDVWDGTIRGRLESLKA